MKNLFKLPLFFSCTCLLAFHASAQTNTGTQQIDSLLSDMYRCPEDTNKVKLLHRVSKEYSRINTNEGLKYGRQGVELSEKLKWDKGLGLCYYSMGRNYLAISDYTNAEESFRASMKMHEKANNPAGVAIGHINMTNIAIDLNQFSDAMEHGYRALEIYAGLGDTFWLEVSLCNIGVTYLEIGDSVNALPIITKSIKICKDIDYTLDECINLNNRSIIYREQKRYMEAKRDANEALTKGAGVDNNFAMMLACKNLGAIAMLEKDFFNARILFNISMKLANDSKSQHRVEVAKGYLGRNYLESAKDATTGKNSKGGLLPGGRKANLDTAIALIREALKMADENHEMGYKISYHEWLSEAYGMSGDVKNAALHKKQAEDLKLLLYSPSVKARIAEITKKNEALLKEVYNRY